MNHDSLVTILDEAYLLKALQTLNEVSLVHDCTWEKIDTLISSDFYQNMSLQFHAAQLSLMTLGPLIEQDSTMVNAVYDKIIEDIIAVVTGLHELETEAIGYDPDYSQAIFDEQMKYMSKKIDISEEERTRMFAIVEKKYEKQRVQDIRAIQLLVYALANLLGDMYGQVLANGRAVKRFVLENNSSTPSFYE
eukprot:TRINITY_DN11789_c0_g1_i1.p1 TRINITY_DN11789_c0_g1~~TRINITY_DN11789_c0_g1_i1.p1  ORF type:complete len:192 (-),score=46.28 TRINITY_DN11789_c0_g1_i1:44-619(-)